MKIILSRKGMDSGCGGYPSPILPDGTLLSLPIPDKDGNAAYDRIYYNGVSYKSIISQIAPKFNFDKNSLCHLDPDVYNEVHKNSNEWKPAFGQCGSSAKHLDNRNVGKGDIFLFYGMFRKTEYNDDRKLTYVKGAPIQHIIYGYMKIGDIIKNEYEMIEKYPWHPHSRIFYNKNNRIYIPYEYGVFKYNDMLVLTKMGQNKRSLWQLPDFFADKDIDISWQNDRHPQLADNGAELTVSCRGQEFVVTANSVCAEKNLIKWCDDIINKNLN